MDTTVPDVHPGFKRKIIIYKNTKPSAPEVYESIRHYCREHGKKYRKISRKNSLEYQRHHIQSGYPHEYPGRPVRRLDDLLYKQPGQFPGNSFCRGSRQIYYIHN